MAFEERESRIELGYAQLWVSECITIVFELEQFAGATAPCVEKAQSARCWQAVPVGINGNQAHSLVSASIGFLAAFLGFIIRAESFDAALTDESGLCATLDRSSCLGVGGVENVRWRSTVLVP